MNSKLRLFYQPQNRPTRIIVSVVFIALGLAGILLLKSSAGYIGFLIPIIALYPELKRGVMDRKTLIGWAYRPSVAFFLLGYGFVWVGCLTFWIPQVSKLSLGVGFPLIGLSGFMVFLYWLTLATKDHSEFLGWARNPLNVFLGATLLSVFLAASLIAWDLKSSEFLISVTAVIAGLGFLILIMRMVSNPTNYKADTPEWKWALIVLSVGIVESLVFAFAISHLFSGHIRLSDNFVFGGMFIVIGATATVLLSGSLDKKKSVMENLARNMQIVTGLSILVISSALFLRELPASVVIYTSIAVIPIISVMMVLLTRFAPPLGRMQKTQSDAIVFPTYSSQEEVVIPPATEPIEEREQTVSEDGDTSEQTIKREVLPSKEPTEEGTQAED